MAELSDLELLAELGVDMTPEVQRTLTPLQERIVAGFEEIQRFVAEHGRLPRHGEDRNIFERLYAVRLDQLRNMPEARELLTPLDADGILDGATPAAAPAALDDEALLAELGIAGGSDADITRLRHVSSRAECRFAQIVGSR